MKNTMNMTIIRDNVFFTQWKDKETGELYLQRKRLPKSRNTLETKQFRDQYIANEFNVIKTVVWLKKQYNWRLHETVVYFKNQFGIKDYSELHPNR